VKPDKYDKTGPLYEYDNVTRHIIKDIQVSKTYFKKRGAKMTIELQAVENQVNEYTKIIGKAVDRMVSQEKVFVDSVKVTSGKLRDSTQKLADGLTRIEKTADFDKLQKYADLLERVERSISALAELESSGKLGKVAEALRYKSNIDRAVDIIAALAALAEAHDTTLDECIDIAYEDIKDRKGYLNAAGVFIKGVAA
jgi:ribosomal protein L24